MLREIKSTQRAMRSLELILTGTGTAVLSGPASFQATLVDNGTGDYTITFKQAFAQTPVVLATSATVDVVCSLAAVSSSAVQIKTRTVADAPAAADAVVHILIMGSDVAAKY